MGPYVLAKLDITSKTQKIWSDTLMVALYYNRARHNVLQTWVCGPEPLTEIVQQGSSGSPVLTLAEIMDSYSLVVQINWLYQYYISLDADAVQDAGGSVSEWYTTETELLAMPTYEESVDIFLNPQATTTT